MKKVILLVATALLLGSLSAIACQTYTYIINGKIVTCTVCGTVTNCF